MKTALRWLALLMAFGSFAAVAAYAAETVTYSYDALGRLTAVQTSGGPNNGQNVSTTFDPAGNRTNYTVTGVAPPGITISNASTTEGSNLVFTVTLSAASGSTVTVNYASADGTATSPADYTAASSTLTFAPGETSKTITVATIDDTVVESAETMTMNLSGASGATITTATGTGTINDNDTASLSIANTSATEGGNLVFTVTRSGSTAGTASAHYATANGTATAGSDYTAGSGTVSFAAGQSTATISVATIDDSTAESPETMTVTLSSPVGATITTATGTGTINDNDVAAATLTIGNASVAEGSPLVFTVTRSGNTSSAVSATWSTSNGTGIAGTNYTGSSGNTVNFAAGVTSATITVPTIDDGAYSPTGLNMTVSLSAPSSGATLGTPSSATGTITNIDMAVLSIGSASANEGSPLSFTVTRSGATNNAVSAVWGTSNATAVSGTNYTGSSGNTVSLAAGATSTTVTVPTIDDGLVTSNLTMNVALSSPSAGASLGTPSAIGTIVNIDAGYNPLGSYALTSGSYYVNLGQYGGFYEYGYVAGAYGALSPNTIPGNYQIIGALMIGSSFIFEIGDLSGAIAPPNSGWTSITVPGLGTMARSAMSYSTGTDSNGNGYAMWGVTNSGTIQSGTVTIQ